MPRAFTADESTQHDAADAFTTPHDTVVHEIQQNGVGDVVIPVERGEIVVLPRLWDLDLTSVDEHGAVLSSGALTVSVAFEHDSARVTDVGSSAPLRSIA